MSMAGLTKTGSFNGPASSKRVRRILTGAGRGASGIIRGMSWSGLVSLGVLLGIIIMAALAPHLARYSPLNASGPELASPCWEHWFGTDELGVDIWAQVCYGARVSLAVGLGAALLAGIGGSLAGIISGYKGGWVDRIISRVIDVMIVMPDLPVMIAVAAFFGPSLLNIIIVLAMFSWVNPARIARSQVLSISSRDYIRAAEAVGARPFYLLRRHFFPEIFPLTAVSMIRLTGKAITAEAGLSFLGLGDPTSKSWGLIIHHASNFAGIYFTDFWKWWLMAPLGMLLAMVLSLAFLSREAEVWADPRIKR